MMRRRRRRKRKLTPLATCTQRGEIDVQSRRDEGAAGNRSEEAGTHTPEDIVAGGGTGAIGATAPRRKFTRIAEVRRRPHPTRLEASATATPFRQAQLSSVDFCPALAESGPAVGSTTLSPMRSVQAWSTRSEYWPKPLQFGRSWSSPGPSLPELGPSLAQASPNLAEADHT